MNFSHNFGCRDYLPVANSRTSDVVVSIPHDCYICAEVAVPGPAWRPQRDLICGARSHRNKLVYFKAAVTQQKNKI